MASRRDETREMRGVARMCAVSRQVKAPEALIRFVAGPDGDLVPDLRCRLPGRGVWVTATAEAVKEAIKRRAFARSLKVKVAVAATLADDIDRLMRRDALQALSFANKAGEAVTGFVKVETAIARTDVVAVLHAEEAAADGIRKLSQALTRRFGDMAADRIATIRGFEAADLGLALGGAHVIHAALIAGPASAGFLVRWRRLAHFRGLGAPSVDMRSPRAQGIGRSGASTSGTDAPGMEAPAMGASDEGADASGGADQD